MKKLLLLVMTLFVAFSLCFSLVSCDKDDDVNNEQNTEETPNDEESTEKEEITYSEGLAFTSNGDGTCYVSGIGTCTDTDINIPPVSPKGDSVTRISSSAFYNCTSLTSVVIGDSVTSIGDRAFYYCSSLTSIVIPDGVISIGSSAFYNTGYYKNSSNWENGVLYIGKYLIEAKDTISGEYVIKNGTKVIADRAFSGCESLTNIVIPDSVTSIGDYAFNGCESLTDVYYTGSNAEWETIDIEGYNSNLTSATIHYNYTPEN